MTEGGDNMSTTKRRIEVFTAGCPVCDESVRLVRSIACGSCEVSVYSLKKPGDPGIEKAKAYGIKSVPSVVVDGKLAECCKASGVTVEGLKASGVGIPR